jgi:hypothetical protein
MISLRKNLDMPTTVAGRSFELDATPVPIVFLAPVNAHQTLNRHPLHWPQD